MIERTVDYGVSHPATIVYIERDGDIVRVVGEDFFRSNRLTRWLAKHGIFTIRRYDRTSN